MVIPEGRFIYVRDNIYKIPYKRKNGLPANRYYIKIPCSYCGKISYQVKSNAGKGYSHACSKVCHYENKQRKQKINKPRGCGQYHIQVLAEDHPNKDRHGRVYEHRLVVEEKIGRFLHKDERVHHINMVKHDNKPENLFLCKNNSNHSKTHGSMNKLVAGLIDEGIIIFDGTEGIYKLRQ
jgi:hypothetical protein